MAKQPARASEEIEDGDSATLTRATDRDPAADVVMVGGMDDGQEQDVEVDLPEQEQDAQRKPQAQREERDAYGGDDDEEEERLGYDEDAPNLSRRQRRNRGRRQAIEARDQEITHLRGALQQMQGQIAGLAQGHVGVVANTIEGQLQNANAAVRMADDELAKAIAAQDAPAIKEFMALRDQAKDRATLLQGAKARLEQQAGQQRQQIDQRRQEQPQQQRQQAPDPAAEKLANVFMDRHPWFAPDGDDEDSILVRALDTKLETEGYLPNTPAYWRELERRVKARGIGPGSEGGMDNEEVEERRPAQRERQGMPPTAAVRSTRQPGKQSVQLNRMQMEALEQEGLIGSAYDSLRGDEKKQALEKRNRIVGKWNKGMAELRRSARG